MPIQDPSTIGVVGAGQMGRGIAQVAARSGFAVLLHDQDGKVLDQALRSIDAGLKHEVEKGRLEERVRAEVIGRIRVAAEPETLSSSDFTIEAISEDRALKTRIFAALDRICRPGVVLASNTSSLSITQIAGATRWAGWRWPTSSVSTPAWPACRSCTRGWVIPSTAPVRCCVGWWMPVCSGRSRGAASTNTGPGDPRGEAGGASADRGPRKSF